MEAPGRTNTFWVWRRAVRWLWGRARCGSRVGVSLDQLRYFVAVAEEENVTRAARRLHVSQPPLSRRIRELEGELGAPLFTRTARGVDLLPAGRALLDHARIILREVDRTAAVVRAGRDVGDG